MRGRTAGGSPLLSGPFGILVRKDPQTVVIETERLLLRPFGAGDKAAPLFRASERFEALQKVREQPDAVLP